MRVVSMKVRAYHSVFIAVVYPQSPMHKDRPASVDGAMVSVLENLSRDMTKVSPGRGTLTTLTHYDPGGSSLLYRCEHPAQSSVQRRRTASSDFKQQTSKAHFQWSDTYVQTTTSTFYLNNYVFKEDHILEID